MSGGMHVSGSGTARKGVMRSYYDLANEMVRRGEAVDFYEACRELGRRGAAARLARKRREVRVYEGNTRRYWWEDKD